VVGAGVDQPGTGGGHYPGEAGDAGTAGPAGERGAVEFLTDVKLRRLV
jgi:hypothetical protein